MSTIAVKKMIVEAFLDACPKDPCPKDDRHMANPHLVADILADVPRGPGARLGLDSISLDLPPVDLHANIAVDPGQPAGAFTRPPG